MVEFVAHLGWDQHFVHQGGDDPDFADQHEVVQRSGVGNGEAQALEAEAVEGLLLAPPLLRRHAVVHPVRLEEAVELVARLDAEC